MAKNQNVVILLISTELLHKSEMKIINRNNKYIFLNEKILEMSAF